MKVTASIKHTAEFGIDMDIDQAFNEAQELIRVLAAAKNLGFKRISVYSGNRHYPLANVAGWQTNFPSTFSNVTVEGTKDEDPDSK